MKVVYAGTQICLTRST